MAVEIRLRHDQTKRDMDAAQSSNVCIYAPNWVSEGLNIVGNQFKNKNVRFEVLDNDVDSTVLESFTLDNSNPTVMSLTELYKTTLGDSKNVHGMINFERYKDLVDDEVIISTKDLIRQCVMVGLDETTHYGGYPPENVRTPQVAPVYVCNLIGLQFQQPYNSGRLVVYSNDGGDDSPTRGLLDDLIFEKVVGEARRSFSDVEKEVEKGAKNSAKLEVGRFRKVHRTGKTSAYFDAFAYSKFVANDVVLAGVAVNQMAKQRNHRVHFKFLKYGSGHFAGEYRPLIEELILPAVVDGMETLFEKHDPKQIASLEFPFYMVNAEADSLPVDKLRDLCSRRGITFSFDVVDALKCTAPDESSVIATTNCADPHVVTGNSMKWSSADAAIAQNLKSRGNIFSACLNKAMQEIFVSLV